MRKSLKKVEPIHQVITGHVEQKENSSAPEQLKVREPLKLAKSNGFIVKKAFIEAFGDSKVHGVSNFIKNEYIWGKFFWLLLFLAGTVGCIYCKS
jgi:hypothetical protein